MIVAVVGYDVLRWDPMIRDAWTGGSYYRSRVLGGGSMGAAAVEPIKKAGRIGFLVLAKITSTGTKHALSSTIHDLSELPRRAFILQAVRRWTNGCGVLVASFAARA